jgi:hypothetical protein
MNVGAALDAAVDRREVDEQVEGSDDADHGR